MKELLEMYTLNEVLIILILSATALKWAWEYKDWLTKKLKETFGSEEVKEEVKRMEYTDAQNEVIAFSQETLKAVYELGDTVMSLGKSVDDLTGRIEDLEKNDAYVKTSVKILLDSDKDDIKSWITEKHHHFVNKGWIDDYSLDCIERRYTHYVDEGGNSFVKDLMEDIRALPKIPQ